MEIKTYYAQDVYGNAIPNATVTLYLADGTTVAPNVFDEQGQPMVNPFTSDATGRITFQVPDGQYNMGITNSRSSGYVVPFQAFDLDYAQQISTDSLVGGIENGDVLTAGDAQTNWQIQNTIDQFPDPAELESTNQFNSGPWSEKRVLAVPEVLDELQFSLFDNVAYPYTILPCKTAENGGFVLPLLGITSVGHSGPVGNNPIRATGNYSAGVTTFRNVSDRVISGLMRGSIEILMRINPTQSPEARRLAGGTPNKPNDMWLCLSAPDGDGLNARDRYAICIVSNWGQIPVFKMRQQNWGVPIPNYTDLAPLLTDITPLAHTVEVGGISGNSVQETLVTNPNGKTTSWIPVGGETLWRIAANGSTTTCRVQFKDAGGRIWYDNLNSGTGVEGKVNQTMEVHPDAVSMRICFALAATETATDLEIKPVPNTIDPCVGTWAKYQLNVSHHVDLIPGVDYQFSIVLFNGVATVDTNSFVVTSGGLSMLFDSRPARYLNIQKVKGIV